LWELAAAQHGVVSLGQVVALGVTPRAVRHRLAAGSLHRIHRGVYAVGHPVVGGRGRWMAAVLACGLDAALSHRSAAALRELRPTSRAAIDVTTPRRAGRGLAGIDAHASRTLTAADVGRVDNIRCTSVARTLLDLGDVVSLREVERAVDQAEVRGLFDLHAVNDVLARANGRRGASKLIQVLAIYQQPNITKSDVEEVLLEICRSAGLPAPLVNGYVGEYQVDFHWPAYRLIVETDSVTWHGTARRTQADYRRDRVLQLRGWRVLRFSWLDVVRGQDEVLATLLPWLASRRSAS
jgi:very-short-patch-repair endonuclease